MSCNSFQRQPGSPTGLLFWAGFGRSVWDISGSVIGPPLPGQAAPYHLAKESPGELDIDPLPLRMSQTGSSRLELVVQALSARLELLEQDNRDLQARVARLESEGYVLIRGERDQLETPPSLSGGGPPLSTITPSPVRAPPAASSSTSAPSASSSATPSESRLTRSGLISSAAWRGTTVAAAAGRRSTWPTGST